jgi:peroxiredoxin
MAASGICEFGWKARDFRLLGVDGKHHTLAQARGPNGLLVAFICNHCPYVKATIDRLVREAAALKSQGIGTIAIMPNDAARSPEDGFEKMKLFAAERGLGFPYVIDETQEIARVYGAVCTPDLFGFNKNLELQYRGRIDSAGMNPPGPETKRELYEAMSAVARTGMGPRDQTASIGCSIKWRSQ